VLDGDASSAVEKARSIEGLNGIEARESTLRAYSDHGGRPLPAFIEAAESSGRTVKDIRLLQPSLETLFVSLTGRKLE
jgi:ABC-2 type transport system ATP-binding protein